MMDSLGQGYRAVVIGASGGIGAALAARLGEDPACAAVHALSRSGRAPEGARLRPGRIDLEDEASVAAAAETVGADGPPALVIVAAGYLHGPAGGPEKSWRQIEPGAMAKAFAVNATGPALVAKHFMDLLPRRERAILAALSARVGSIGDNRAGGWYGYRASKAALNQILRCLAIEGARKRPELVVAGLQPGTVRTELSAPFRSHVAEEELFEPAEAAANLLSVLDRLPPERSGGVFDWQGEAVPP
jgi:NAD(P)-dependent dehydrogenase (short-subunit alcohol dehydrogenase family)